MKRTMVVLIALAASVTLWAADDFDQLPPGKWWENPRVVEHLKLSEEQQRLIHDRVYEHAVRMIDLKAAVERAELTLRESADRDDFNAASIRTAFKGFQQARLALESERFEMLLAVRQLLTTEQWRQMQELRQRFERRHPDDERRPMGRPGRFGGPQDQPPRHGDGVPPPESPAP